MILQCHNIKIIGKRTKQKDADEQMTKMEVDCAISSPDDIKPKPGI